MPTDRPLIFTMDGVPDENVQWLWQQWIPLSRCTLVDGDPGVGKSTVLLDVSARVSCGRPMPLELLSSIPPSDVLIINCEDGAADVIRPRLRAAGADLKRVHLLLGTVDGRNESAMLSLPDDLDVVQDVVNETGAKLVIVDPIMSHMSWEYNSYNDHEMREFLHFLNDAARLTGAAIVLVRHLNKRGGTKALYRGGGSIGLMGGVRSSFLVAESPTEPHTRIVACLKNNLARKPRSITFRMEEAENIRAPRIEWLDHVDCSADDALEHNGTPKSSPNSALDTASGFLNESLKDGPVAARDVETKAADRGITSRTLRRARETLAVISEKGVGGAWYWRLPEDR